MCTFTSPRASRTGRITPGMIERISSRAASLSSTGRRSSRMLCSILSLPFAVLSRKGMLPILATGIMMRVFSGSGIVSRRRSFLLAIFMVAGLAALPARPQSKAVPLTGTLGGQPGPPDTKIRVSVDLAQTDVVVTDRAGHPVRNLEASDFQLFEIGQIRTITNFSWVDVAPPAQKPQASARHSTLALTPASIPQRGNPRRALVLMVDDAGTSASDLQAALPEIRRFAAEQIHIDDLAAVTAS